VVLGVNAFIILLTPRYFSVGDINILMSTLGITSLFWLLLDWGINNHIIATVAQSNTIQTVSQAYYSKLFVSLVTGLLGGSVILLLSLAPDFTSCLVLMGISLLFLNVIETYHSSFIGQHQMEKVAIWTFVQYLLIAIGTTVTIHYWPSIVALCAVFLLSRIIVLLCLTFVYKRVYISKEGALQKICNIKYLSRTLPKIGSSNLFGQLLNQGILFASIYMFHSAGKFGLAMKLLSALLFLSTSAFEFFLATASKTIPHIRRTHLQISLLLIVLIFIIIYTIWYIFGRQIVIWFWGVAYGPVYQEVLYLLWLYPLFSGAILLHYFQIAEQQPLQVFLFILGFFFVNWILLTVEEMVWGIQHLSKYFVGNMTIFFLFLVGNHLRYVRTKGSGVQFLRSE